MARRRRRPTASPRGERPGARDADGAGAQPRARAQQGPGPGGRREGMECRCCCSRRHCGRWVIVEPASFQGVMGPPRAAIREQGSVSETREAKEWGRVDAGALSPLDRRRPAPDRRPASRNAPRLPLGSSGVSTPFAHTHGNRQSHHSIRARTHCERPPLFHHTGRTETKSLGVFKHQKETQRPFPPRCSTPRTASACTR